MGVPAPPDETSVVPSTRVYLSNAKLEQESARPSSC